MRKFSEIQEWKYQKKKKPLVFLQEDIAKRELLDESLENSYKEQELNIEKED